MNIDKIRQQYGPGRNYTRFALDRMEGQTLADVPATAPDTWHSYPVQVQVVAIRAKCSKSGTVYYSVQIRDETNASGWLTMWADELETHFHLLKIGAHVRMKIRPPTNGFTSYTLEHRPRRATRPDERVIKMQLPLPPLRNTTTPPPDGYT